MIQPVNYQVLARTTRPKKFSEVIGQEAIAQTIKNAIESGRLAHAFILTGTHGVGKTTMARLIACALNCAGEGRDLDKFSEPCGQCPQCQAVFQDHHVDVVEVDAATRTGVDDMRQLMEGVSYKPVLGRYKIYIIDEVHMLSKSAFNALLKTLEEPPPHAKFIFATTEIRKVPLTVLSRCQRFDLRRVSAEVLVSHFKRVLDRENVGFELDALECVARASNGSVRDGLSILEQAIVKSIPGNITVSIVQEMLGLSDKGKVLKIYEFLIKGRVKECLDATHELYMEGAEPQILLQDFMSLTYELLSLKVTGDKIHTMQLETLASQIETESLILIWHVLMKGTEEIKISSMPLENLEVILIRAMHIQEIIEEKEPVQKEIQSKLSVSELSSSIPAWAPKTFKEMVHLFEKKREPIIVDYLKNNVSVVSFEPGKVSLNILRPGPENLHLKITKLLSDYTGVKWIIEVTDQKGEEALGLQEKQNEEKRQKSALETEEAKKISALFPGAHVVVK